MVRLSLIVLGLLVAAWCFTGTADGLYVKRYKKTTKLSCPSGYTMRIGRCGTFRRKCPASPFGRRGVKCISSNSMLYLRRICNAWKKTCYPRNSIRRGNISCEYFCGRKPSG
ncbi:uncharacterized protein AB9X84_007943 isoform 1-T1 [Acanthopagrus schlegelii]